ncbi:MAG: CHASE2 domain-containing protein, partial [Actinomycetota bacterium]
MRSTTLRIATSLLIAVGTMLIAWGGLVAGVFGGLQIRLTDALFQGSEADPAIVVVAIDGKSLEDYGRWPWDRRLHASLIDKLNAAGTRRIGYDVLFTEPSNPGSDRALGAAVDRAGNVVLAAAASFRKRSSDVLVAESYQPPIDSIASGAAGIAHVNVFPDADGVVRALPVVLEISEDTVLPAGVEGPSNALVPSLGLAMVEPRAGTQPVTILRDGVVTGGRLVRTGEGHLLDVNFVAANAFPVISAADVLRGRVPAARLRGKIALVGVTAVALGDQKLTPIDKSEGQPGVFVHANAANTLSTSQYLIPERRVETLAWVFVLALLTALVMTFVRVWITPAFGAVFGGGFALFTFWRFDNGRVGNLVYPPAGMVLSYVAALGVRYFTEFRERRRVTQVFARYVAQDVVDEVLASP